MENYRMLLYCAICGKPWRRIKVSRADGRPVKRPTASCTKCRIEHFAATQRTVWKHRRRRLELAGEALPPIRPITPDELARLISEADAASTRALEAARTIALRKLSDKL